MWMKVLFMEKMMVDFIVCGFHLWMKIADEDVKDYTHGRSLYPRLLLTSNPNMPFLNTVTLIIVVYHYYCLALELLLAFFTISILALLFFSIIILTVSLYR